MVTGMMTASVLAGGGACLADDAGDGFRRLGTDREPFVGFFQVDAVIGAIDEWIVGAKLLDVHAVTALAAVHGHDFVIGAVFGPFAIESDSYSHDDASFQ